MILEITTAKHSEEVWTIPIDVSDRLDSTPLNEIQTLTVTGAPTGGNFTITFLGQTTAPIPHDADAASIQSALEALSNIDTKEVAVLGAGPFTVEFSGQHAGLDLNMMTTDVTGLTGGSTPDVIVTETVVGGTLTEQIVLIEGSASISKKFESIQNIDLEGSDEVVVLVVKPNDDDVEVRISDIVGDNMQLKFDTTPAPADNTVWDAGQLTIAPSGQEFEVVIKGGVAGNTYDLDLNVVTDSDDTYPNTHKVILRWTVN